LGSDQILTKKSNGPDECAEVFLPKISSLPALPEFVLITQEVLLLRCGLAIQPGSGKASVQELRSGFCCPLPSQYHRHERKALTIPILFVRDNNTLYYVVKLGGHRQTFCQEVLTEKVRLCFVPILHLPYL